MDLFSAPRRTELDDFDDFRLFRSPVLRTRSYILRMFRLFYSVNSLSPTSEVASAPHRKR